MKHLILSGGRPWRGEDGGKLWVQALLAHCGSEARIGFCVFAQEEAEWPETIRSNAGLITKFAGDTAVNSKTMTAESFTEVSEWANVIVIPGGIPERLEQALKPYGDILQLWDGKTISGSSAGADIMCERYMYLQDRVVKQGFGWVPVSFIPHWQADLLGWKPEDWRWAETQLARGPGELPLLCVREADFVELAVQ
jgi:hypothetical protein